MLRKLISRVLLPAVLLTAGLSAVAQDGAYSGYTPYSIYGIGDLFNPGSAYSQTMGGVGVATRNPKYINLLNPASVTARDSLSFMMDFSLYENNKYMLQDGKLGVNNLFNLRDIVISFPLYRSSAMMLGVMPYSTTGYKYSSYEQYGQDLIAETQDISSVASGQGGVYKVFAAAGVTFWKRLSLGVEGIHYFGNIKKQFYPMTFTSSSYSSIESGYRLFLSGNTARVGIQYEQPVGPYVIGAGATYTLGTDMKGYVTDYRFSKGVTTDTLRYVSDTLGSRAAPLRFASELAVGVSLRYGQRWRAEVDYTMSDWSRSGFDAASGFAMVGEHSAFSATKSESIRAGFEIIPNANDIRYFYRRWAYRVGFYREKAYYLLDGNEIQSIGLTFGATIPVVRLSNGLTVGMEIGRRGTRAAGGISENFVNFSLGVNMYDIWFQKTRYQ